MKTAVVTGTSTGIGFETALHLARNGYQVKAAMRNLGKSEAIKKAASDEGLNLEVILMDVNSDTSVTEAFAAITEPVDVLVNNAGVGGATPLELTPMDEHKATFETNYFGAVRCIQAVLPSMRERTQGCIVNITSMEGIVAMPNQVAYSASKWALECLGEALAHEMVRFGVRVVNVEPGVIMTQIFDNSAEMTRYDKTSPYQPLMRRNGKMFMAGFKEGISANVVAETILESIETDTYKLRWPVGSDAKTLSVGRKKISDEDWVAMGENLSDEEYNSRYMEYFGIQL